MIPVWSRLGPLGKWHVAAGMAVAFVGSLTVPRGHVTVGVALMALGVGVVGTTVSLAHFGRRARARETASTVTSTRGGLATQPPTWSDQ